MENFKECFYRFSYRHFLYIKNWVGHQLISNHRWLERINIYSLSCHRLKKNIVFVCPFFIVVGTWPLEKTTFSLSVNSTPLPVELSVNCSSSRSHHRHSVSWRTHSVRVQRVVCAFGIFNFQSASQKQRPQDTRGLNHSTRRWLMTRRPNVSARWLMKGGTEWWRHAKEAAVADEVINWWQQAALIFFSHTRGAINTGADGDIVKTRPNPVGRIQ